MRQATCSHMNRFLIVPSVCIAFVAGCGQPSGPAAPSEESSAQAPGSRVKTVSEETPLKLAFVTNNTSEFWKIAQKGLEKARAEHGIEIDYKAPNTGKVEEQKKILEDLVSQGYHGVAISVIAAEDQTRDIDRAAERLNVITQDSDAPKSQRLAYIGTNNYQAGRALGEEIKKRLPEGGEMAVFVGTLAADNARERLKGIEDAIAGAGIEIIAKKEDNKDQNKANTNVEDVITAHPDIDLLAGLWSYNGPAILAAVERSGKQGAIKVVAFDEEDATLDGIERGSLECTVVQKPFEFGYRSALLLRDLCQKGAEALPEGGIVDTGVEVIDKSNVSAFKKKLAELRR